MYEGQTIGVVVPAYNEEGFVGEVIDTMPSFVDRVYAVDDASTDDTWTEIREHARRVNERTVESATTETGVELSPRVIPIRHEQNRGAGGTVKTGYDRALSDGIDVTAVMDGDGQMDPDDLERIVAPVAEGEVTYAKGDRLRFRENRAEMSRWRLFGNVLLTMLTRISSGYWDLSDPQNGYTAISREGLRRVPLERLYERYGFLNDMLVSLNINDEPIADVSHSAVYGEERSDIAYSTFVPGLSWLLARNFLRRLTTSYLVRGFHPLVACYLFGTIVVLVGLLGGVQSLLRPTVDSFLGGMLSFTVLTLGGLFLVLGTWFDVKQNEGLVERRRHLPDRDRRSDPERLRATSPPVEIVGDGGDERRPGDHRPDEHCPRDGRGLGSDAEREHSQANRKRDT